MEFAVLGWPDDGPTLRLDYRRFAYAGKFVMSNTGKAVVRDGGTDAAHADGDSNDATDAAAANDDIDPTEYDTDVVAAAAFNADRTDETALWIRYVTVRADRKGEALGPRLCAFVADRADDAGVETLRIAVNNPFAYEALYKAGFAWTGETTGLAELVLERPAGAPATRTPERYRAGLDRYRARDPADPEASFLAARESADPPSLVAGDSSDARR